MRILIIDSDEVIREELSSKCISWGYECDTASTVKSTIRLLISNTYNWLVTDSHLSDGNAFDIIKVIKLPDCNIILYVSEQEYDNINSDLDSHGVVKKISKNDSPDEVLKYIKQYIKMESMVKKDHN